MNRKLFLGFSSAFWVQYSLAAMALLRKTMICLPFHPCSCCVQTDVPFRWICLAKQDAQRSRRIAGWFFRIVLEVFWHLEPIFPCFHSNHSHTNQDWETQAVGFMAAVRCTVKRTWRKKKCEDPFQTKNSSNTSEMSSLKSFLVVSPICSENILVLLPETRNNMKQQTLPHASQLEAKAKKNVLFCGIFRPTTASWLCQLRFSSSGWAASATLLPQRQRNNCCSRGLSGRVFRRSQRASLALSWRLLPIVKAVLSKGL